MCEFYENYQRLAEAIIVQAVKDYRRSRNHQSQNSIESFFRSDWFATLSRLDGEILINKLRKERMIRNG